MTTQIFPTHYQHGDETLRYEEWRNRDCFAPKPAAQRFAMLMPPPNITGSLHIGHAYELTLSDTLSRYHRMQGEETLWLPGTDHAGIATQSLIERRLNSEGLTRKQIGKEAFLQRIWDWKTEAETSILNQMTLMGTSADWDRQRFTLDSGPAEATHEAFTRLYNEGLIYRASRNTSWCSGCETTLSDIETELNDPLDPEQGSHCTRCSSAIEIHSTPQWFLSTSLLAQKAREAFTSGLFTIEPTHYATEYLRWLDNMEDWCLSRQLWWGHRLPIWTNGQGDFASYGPHEEIPEGWIQEDDTLDTWFSSALWPLSTLGWPHETADLARYYPQDLLLTGYDLLFFWATRMIMLCTHLYGTPPFRRLHLHGMIRDEHGKKMAKSFGNTIDPLELLAQYGPDTLRLALTRRARPGADISFGESDLIGASALLKKLWSITRFAHLNQIGFTSQDSPPSPTHPFDIWILSRLTAFQTEWEEALDTLDLSSGCDALNRFLNEELSDFYLEARKGAFKENQDAQQTLATILRTLLLLLHPLTPFLTEELWERITGESSILDSLAWPSSQYYCDTETQESIAALRFFLHEIRAYREKQKIGKKQPLHASFASFPLSMELADIANLALSGEEEGEGEAYTLGKANMILTSPAPALNPLSTEKRREEARIRLEKAEQKLSNPLFLANAPREIQEETRQRRDEALRELGE